MKETNENYLADWLSGNLTDEQLKQKVSAEDFVAYQKLKSTFSTLEIAPPDMGKNFSAIKQKLANPIPKQATKIFPIWRVGAIAASLVLCFGIYHFFIAQNKITTGFGASKEIVLSDHSKVSLNAKSELCYSNYFAYKRTLHLHGEAFFEVQKGSPFTVETPLGNITVLGTKFNVIAFRDFFEVVCYEGKVSVTQNGKATLLTHGESVRFYNHTAENWVGTSTTKPSWLSGESSFKNVPVQYVMNKFEDQYEVSLSYPKTVANIKFTGTFTHDDLDVALQTICTPLHLHYTKTDSGKILISE